MVRFKNRYIAVKVDPRDSPLASTYKLNSSALYHSVMDKVQELHGDFGVAAIKTAFSAKYCNELTRVALLRVRHGPHKLVTSSIPFVRKIGEEKVVIQTLHIGATMLHCNKFLQRYHRRTLEEMWMGMKPEARKNFEELIMKLDLTKIKNKNSKS